MTRLALAAILSLGCGGTLTAPEVPPSCASLRAKLELAGAQIPGNFSFRCPDNSIPRLGITSWNGTTGSISINLAAIEAFGLSPEFVLAHEICHAWDLNQKGSSTEEEADACASAYGFNYEVLGS